MEELLLGIFLLFGICLSVKLVKYLYKKYTGITVKTPFLFSRESCETEESVSKTIINLEKDYNVNMEPKDLIFINQGTGIFGLQDGDICIVKIKNLYDIINDLRKPKDSAIVIYKYNKKYYIRYIEKIENNYIEVFFKDDKSDGIFIEMIGLEDIEVIGTIRAVIEKDNRGN